MPLPAVCRDFFPCREAALMKRDIVTFLTGNGVSCDYIDAVTLLETLRNAPEIDPDLLDRALDICAKGTLLPGYEYEWLDRYKAVYSELVISVMMKSAEDIRASSDENRLVKVADCILREDALDESAVRLKCRILYAKGHKGLARDTYDKWCADYRRAMADDPQLSYNDIVMSL